MPSPNAPASEPLTFNKKRLVQIFFFVAFGFLLYQLAVILEPFVPAILGAAILATAFYPGYNWLKKRFRNANLAALTMTVAVFLGAVIPVVLFGAAFFHQAGRFFPEAQNYLNAAKEGDIGFLQDKIPNSLKDTYEIIKQRFSDWGINPKPFLMRQIQSIGNQMMTWGALSARKIFIATINGLFLLIGLFFIFRDGKVLFEWVITLIPLEPDHKTTILRRAYEIFRAVAVGVTVTAAAQGMLAMIGYMIAGVPFFVFWSLLTMLVSFLGASFVVSIPIALFMFTKSTGWGFFLLIWGIGVVGLIDNFLKPILIGSRARMPFIIILFSIIGGVKAYGPIGFILGPIVIASLLTFVRIYREQYEK